MSPNTLPRGALLGAGLGLALSLLLLILGSLEGSEFAVMALAAGLGAPTSIALKQLGWIDHVSSLAGYVLLVVPLNWALVGAAVGGIVQLRTGRRRLAVALPALGLIVGGYLWFTRPWPRVADPRSAMDRVRAMAGCWRFEPSAPFSESRLVRFDTVPRLASQSELKLALDTDEFISQAFWALAKRPGDLVVGWSNSLPVELRLTVHGDTLLGMAYMTNDVGSRWRAPARAARVTCPVHVVDPVPAIAKACHEAYSRSTTRWDSLQVDSFWTPLPGRQTSDPPITCLALRDRPVVR